MQRHRTEIQMRFGDTDALGHVNNASFAAYAEVARLDFMRQLGRAVTSLILANLAIDFRRQVTWGEAVWAETWVERLGRSSITLAQTIYAAGEPAADVRSVIVHFDYAARAARELPAEARAQLAPFVATA